MRGDDFLANCSDGAGCIFGACLWAVHEAVCRGEMRDLVLSCVLQYLEIHFKRMSL